MAQTYQVLCSPESKPLLTLEELLEWDCSDICRSDQSMSYSICELQTHKTHAKSGSKTLLCHDMKGGYLDDRFNSGCANETAYRFFLWSSIDVFVYFSHNFITIPPITWINASHKNGVPILGTIIVEGWSQTNTICDQMLKSRDVIKKVVVKLVDISKYYHFMGWLINIECPVSSDCIENLVYFVKLLTDSMHSCLPKSLVIWYDSVISPGGELKWQNELNCNNWCFFDACDAIFLNYTWNETNLKTSYERAHQMRRNYDVFVGIDVFGRNCFGGGGLHTNLAVREALKHELSIALFASAWTHEVLGYENFTNNEYLFWSLLDLGVHHFPQTFPIYTSFCQGFGLKMYKNGQISSENKWHNLSEQELQPTNHKSVEVYIEEAFNGGGCLRLTDTLVHLFECEIMVEKKCFYAITYKSISNHKLNTIFKYQNENNENENKALILFDNESENKDFFIQYIDINENRDNDELRKFSKFGIFEANNGWITLAFIIQSKSDDFNTIVKSIELNVCHQIENNVIDVLVGQLIFDTI